MATKHLFTHWKRISKCQCTISGRMAMYSTVSTTSIQPGDTTDPVKPFKDVPGPGGLYKLPIIGTLLHFKPFSEFTNATVQTLLDSLVDKYGPVVKVQVGQPTVLISDPKDMDTVFKNEGKYPIRPAIDISTVYAKRNKRNYNFGELQGEDWHKLRAILNKRFMKVNSAHFYLKPQNSVADEFVDILTAPKLDAKEVSDLFFRFSAESIGVVCFNTRIGFLASNLDQESQDFLRASRDVFKYLHQSISGGSIAHKWYRNKTYKGYEMSRHILAANARKHINTAKAEIEARRTAGTLDPDEPNLLLSLLSDPSMPEEDLVLTLEILYIGGTDSTARNMQTFFYILAMNPDKQEKLREEILSIFGHDEPVAAEGITQLKYMRACLKESFRLIFPTVCGPLRILPVDVVLSGYRIPAGTRMMMHCPKACKDCFVNPDKYIPERWLRESEGYRPEEVPPTASFPFGHGPRSCVGRRLAEQEMYLGTLKVLQKFRIGLEPESRNVNFIYRLFAQPIKPFQFKFTELNKGT